MIRRVCNCLSPDEQYAHISLWAILSAPLLIGCDMRAIDDFTLGLLTNSEVIAVNQDPLVAPAVKRMVVLGPPALWNKDEDIEKAWAIMEQEVKSELAGM